MFVRTCWALMLAFLIAAGSAQAAEPLAGYLDYEAFLARVQKLGETKHARVTSYGKSRQDRDLWVIEFGGTEQAKDAKPTGKKPVTEAPLSTKPAWVVVGSIQPDHPLGSEMALRMAEKIAAQAAEDEGVQKLLARCTVYIIPRPDPDGLEKCFALPRQLSVGNGAATDDDRDFMLGEDPANDLNGDGWITQLRVADESGTHRLHPDDPRVLIEIDPKKNESATFRILSEGIDDDHDEAFNEDGSGGVNLNCNFTFRYAPFQPNTGANAVSEPESRALADLLFDRPQIAGVLTFSTEDNLFHPWKHDGGKDKGRNRQTIAAKDETVVNRLAEEFRELHGGKNCPPSSSGRGSFSEWAYFHFGRWSLASRGWWVPEVPAEDVKQDEPKKEEDSQDEEEKQADDEQPKAEEIKQADEKKKPTDEKQKEKRGAEELNALRWLAKEDIQGFVDWQPIEHPDFPGKKVEVGGFKPFARTQPPVAAIDELADRHVQFLGALVKQLPELALVDTKVEALGGNTFRITTNVVNRGPLPTMPEIGGITEQAYPLQIVLSLPTKTEFLLGHQRGSVRRLKGQGDKEEKVWLIRFSEEVPKSITIRVWAPAVGQVETSIDLPQ